MNTSKEWDSDIEKLELSDVEKNGLQVFRNYSNAFENFSIIKCIDELDKISLDTAPLEKISSSILKEDVRFLPILVCAYADDLMGEMYKEVIPENMPGGRTEILGSFGPLGNFANKIKLSFCFDLLSKDLLISLDLLRKIRNDISHNWDLNRLIDFLSKEPANKIYNIEEALDDGIHFPPQFYKNLNDEQKFKIRLQWVTGRILFECTSFPTIRKARLEADSVLYFHGRKPKMLTKIATISLDATLKIAEKNV